MQNGMIGADPQALRDMANYFDDAAHELLGVKGAIQFWVDMTDFWLGLNYFLFKDMWEITGARTLVDAASIFHHAAGVLRQNADDQDRVSVASGGQFIPKGGSGLFGKGVTKKAPWGASGFFQTLHNQPEESRDGVRIQKIRSEDGIIRYIVYLNGTTQSDTGHFSVKDALASEYGPGSETYEMVTQKMREAGIDRSSEVLYVGYSQGGMQAQHIAASGEFGHGVILAQGSPATSAPRSNYDIVHINVAGDPIPAITVPGSFVYDAGNLIADVAGYEVGEKYTYTHFDKSAMWENGKPVIAHCNGSAYERATVAFEESSDKKAVEMKRKIEKFHGGEIVADSR